MSLNQPIIDVITTITNLAEDVRKLHPLIEEADVLWNGAAGYANLANANPEDIQLLLPGIPAANLSDVLYMLKNTVKPALDSSLAQILAVAEYSANHPRG